MRLVEPATEFSHRKSAEKNDYMNGKLLSKVVNFVAMTSTGNLN